jgi:hypothetical protein
LVLAVVGISVTLTEIQHPEQTWQQDHLPDCTVVARDYDNNELERCELDNYVCFVNSDGVSCLTK